MRARILPIFYILSILYTVDTFAFDNTFSSGKFDFETAYFDKNQRNDGQLVADIDFGADLNDSFQLNIGGIFTSYFNQPSSMYRINFDGTTLVYRSTFHKVQVGIDKVSWARIDFFSQLESMNTADFNRFLLKGVDDLSYGNAHILLTSSPLDNFTTSLFFSPWLRTSYLASEESRWSFIDQTNGRIASLERNDLISSALPSLDIHTAPKDKYEVAFGLRAQAEGDNSDAAISFLRAPESSPNYLLEDGKLIPVFAIPSTITLDLSRGVGEWVIKSELSYVMNLYKTRQDFNLFEVNQWEGGLSLEGYILENLPKVTLTLYGQYGNYKETSLEVDKELSTYISIEENFFDEKLIAEINFLGTLNASGQIYTAKLRYENSDISYLTLQGQMAKGTYQSIAGFYQDNDSISIGLDIEI